MRIPACRTLLVVLIGIAARGLPGNAAEPPPYPAYHAVVEISAAPTGKVESSGTAAKFVLAAYEDLQKRTHLAWERPTFPSSAGVAEALLNGECHLGFMSVPLTAAEKERFAVAHGYPIIEAAVAQDAIEVLVNAANPVESITLAQLRAVYEEQAPEGGRKLIRDWAQLGGEPGEIKAYGGSALWGTTRYFQQEILGGAAFRKDMVNDDVVPGGGIETSVAGDPLAIGFVSLGAGRPAGTRALSLAQRKGEPGLGTDPASLLSGNYPLQRYFYAYLARRSFNAAEPVEREMLNLLLSAEGQALVAQAGSLPLDPADVRKTRDALGLPR